MDLKRAFEITLSVGMIRSPWVACCCGGMRGRVR